MRENGKATYLNRHCLYLPMHLSLSTSNGGPLGHPAGSRPTRHGRRINRQKADERHREINVDGVVERDTECVGDINEFGSADGYQSGLDGVRVYFDDNKTRTGTWILISQWPLSPGSTPVHQPLPVTRPAP